MTKKSEKVMSRLMKALQGDRFNYPKNGGSKKYYGLDLCITKLIWARNLIDGWTIEVSDQGKHRGTIKIDRDINEIKLIPSVY